MMCSYNKLCFQCIEYKRRRVVRLPVDWYSIGESNGAPSPRNRTERRVWSHHLLNVTSYVTSVSKLKNVHLFPLLAFYPLKMVFLQVLRI